MKRISPAIAALIFLFSAVHFSCHRALPLAEMRFPAADRPPAGLTPEQVPQFIVFGSDDNGYSGLAGSGGSGGLHFLTEMFAGQRNPEGGNDPRTFDASPLHYSFYVNTFYITADAAGPPVYEGRRENPVYVKRAWKEALDGGHEIGVHTHSHPHGSELNQLQWQEEMQRCIEILGRPFEASESPDHPNGRSGLGTGPERLAGFRTPFLEYNDDALKAARQLGFLYDCSIEEGTQPDRDGTDFPWPYRLDRGSPAQPSLIGPHPGLWEIPVYVFMVPPDEACGRYGVPPGLRAEMKRRQDYFDPAAGKITGMDWNLWCEFAATPAEFLAILKYTLDLRLSGNRCPLTIGLHSELYSDKDDTTGLRATVAERRAALREFFAYALQIPQVRVVNHIELLHWLQRPEALAVPAAPQADAKELLIGAKIYGYKGDFADLFAAWQKLGINTAFVSIDLANNRVFMDLARDHNIAVYIIFPAFYNPEALAKDPGLFAVTGHGLPAKSDWVEFVCPRRPEYRRQRLAYLRDLVRTCQPDGISIDFIRYFAFWEMVYPGARLDPLQNTCFCPYCLQAFQRECGSDIPDRLAGTSARAEWILAHHLPAWAKWKRAAITSLVADITAAARQEKPGIKFNVHLVPWRDNDFGGAMGSLVSQDIAAIGSLVDYLSPMCYAHMVKQTPGWIRSVIQDIQSQAPNPILPSIQVKEEYITEALTPFQFSAYLKTALEPPSQGVVFWSWETLAADAAKMEIARSHLAGQGTRQNPNLQ